MNYYDLSGIVSALPTKPADALTLYAAMTTIKITDPGAPWRFFIATRSRRFDVEGPRFEVEAYDLKDAIRKVRVIVSPVWILRQERPARRD
jgi:hypothetical protein